MPFFFPHFDPTYILVIAGVLISIAASANVNGSFRKYSQVFSQRGIRAEQAAEMILRGAGIQDVSVQRISGNLTDHYDPRSKVLRLSDDTYGSTSVAALGVAAHECGHAIQHNTGYIPLQIRGALVPIVNFGSSIAWILIAVGLFFNSRSSILFLNLGILVLTFGLSIKITIASIIGVVLAIIIYRFL